MTNLYQDFAEILKKRLLKHNFKHSLQEVNSLNNATYAFYLDRNGINHVVSEQKIEQIINEYYQFLIDPQSKKVSLIMSQFADLQAVYLQLLKTANKNDNLFEHSLNSSDKKLSLEFLHVFNNFFENKIPHFYTQLISSTMQYHKQSNDNEGTHLLLENIIKSLIKDNKVFNFHEEGEQNLITILDKMRTINFSAKNYHYLKNLLNYHDLEGIKNEKGLLIVIKEFIKDKISLNYWPEFEIYTKRKIFF